MKGNEDIFCIALKITLENYVFNLMSIIFVCLCCCCCLLSMYKDFRLIWYKLMYEKCQLNSTSFFSSSFSPSFFFFCLCLFHPNQNVCCVIIFRRFINQNKHDKLCMLMKWAHARTHTLFWNGWRVCRSVSMLHDSQLKHNLSFYV